MNDIVIKAEHVSKKFCKSLRYVMTYGATDITRDFFCIKSKTENLRDGEFWAVNDVSFELKRGGTLGLIGPNGSGKSTILKMLNGIYMPDQGRLTIKGRVGALIEVGAGFHPILTGRENIYVNGTILGMSKKEIDKKFDEIVDFADIGDFLDSPVKHYSSGMYVRLGFAVAMNCEPDIVLVDEVLAVGDVSFRTKCYKKLAELKDKGVSWILVSHDMGTIRNQTSRAVFLENGRMRFIGTPDDAISKYLYSTSEQTYLKNKGKSTDISKSISKKQLDAQITKVSLLDMKQKEVETFKTGEPLIIKIDYIAYKKIENPSFGVAIYGGDGMLYCGTNTLASRYQIDCIEGKGSVFFQMKCLSLFSGIYRVRVEIHDKYMGSYDQSNEAAYLRVKGGMFGSGLFYPEHSWDIKNQE